MTNIITEEGDRLLWDMWMSTFFMPVIAVGDEIGYFKILGQQRLKINEIAIRLDISLRAAEVLTNALASIKFVKIINNEVNLLIISSKYLLPDSDFYWGKQLHSYRNENLYIKILNAMKSSSPQLRFSEETFSNMWEHGSINEEAANDFTHKMQATHLSSAHFLANSGILNDTKKLLDIGAGSGCFSITFVEKYSNATATLFDLPMVCKLIKGYADKSPCKDRLNIYPGNFFTDQWPKDHDAVLLSQILHDWPYETSKMIIQLAFNALKENGRIFIHEMLLDEDKSSPATIVFFDLLMFINHQSQQFNRTELFNLLVECGFKDVKVSPMLHHFSLISAQK